MNRNFIKWCIFLISQSLLIRYVESSASNETTSDENRHPRVSGRIVKLYPGYKPEPITCTEEGFRADPVDCSTFYRCIMAKSGKFSVLRFQCGPGTVYDPDTEVCNHPHNTKRSECGTKRPYQFLIAPFDQVNENDIDSSAHEIPSPITTWKPLNVDQISSSYRPSIGPSTPEYQSMTSFGYGSPVKETHKQIATKTEELSTSKTSVVSTSYPWSTSFSSTNHPKLTIAQSKEPRDITNECYHDGFMGDNNNCRKFYRCVNNQRGGFTKYEFMCSESTIWDDELQSCNHPWAVRRSRCVQDVRATENISNSDYYSNTNKNIADKHSIGPIKTTSSTQTYYGDRINVDQANVVSNSNNLNILNNSYSIENEYVPSTIQHKPTQPTSHYLDPLINTQKQLYESTTKVSTYNAPYQSNKGIYIKCTESGFMGDPNDCRKFYRCVQNGKDSYIRHEFLCGEGTAWDERAESCNHAWMVKECGMKLLHDMSTTKQSYVEDKHTTTGPIIITQENAYNIGGQQSKEPSSLPVTTGTLLDQPDKDDPTEMCSSAGYKGSETDCRKFYRCIENDNGGFTKFEYICDEGTVWDSNIEACNHLEVVKNCVHNANTATKLSTSSTEPSIITTISFIQSTIQSSSVGYNDEIQDVSYYKESTPNIELTNTNNKCQKNGFMADQYNCRKFFRCVENGDNNFIRFEYACGDGTAWDAKINACNHLRAVPTCGNNYDSESTSIKHPPSESYENVNNYTTIINNNDVNTLRTESTTATNLGTELTTSNNKLNRCSRSGFIGDNSDCKKFYRCVLNSEGSYTKYEFSCGEGTVWDPEIEACNHPSAVNKCGGSLEEQKEVSTSPPKPSTTMQAINDEINNGYIQSNGDAESPAKNTSQVSSEYQPIYETTQECNKVGFLADTNDCKKFYRCVENGQGGLNRVEFSCSDGTAWDQKLEACNHISLVKECSSISNEISASTVISPVHSTVASYPQHDEAPTTSKPTNEKDNCINEGFYGNENDCKKFFRCVSDQQGGFTKYEFSCGDGTIWDQNIQACNHEYSDNLNCTISSTTDSKPIAPGSVNEPANNQESQDHIPLNETSTTEKDVDLASNRNNTCSSEGFYPNFEDCKKFIRCVNDGEGKFIKYDFTCGEGTIWVQDIQACDHENDNSTCSSGISTTTEAHIDNTQTTQSTQTNTPSTVQNTITSGNVDSTKNPVITQSKNDECHSEGYYANSNDCRRFYRCVVGDHEKLIKYDYICGEGTAWDIDTQTCNHIGSVKRCTSAQDSQTTTLETNAVQAQTTIPPTTNALQPQATESIKTTSTAQPETTENTKTTVALTTKQEQPQTTENIKTTIQPTSNSVVTPTQGDHSTVQRDNCQAEGYFGNKEDCRKFYRCVNNGQGGYTKYDYTCGEGTLWDQDILACNHPQDVKSPSCKEDSKTSPSSGTTQSSIQSTESTSSSSSSSSQLTPTSTTTKQTTVSSVENSSQDNSNCSSSENVKNENLNCTKAGYFPNPNNCKKFYRCVDWDGDGQRFSIFHFECGEGTIWDPALDTCNYEDSVYPPRNCKGLQPQNSGTSSTSTESIDENTTSSTSSEINTQTTQTTQQVASTESTTQQITSTESTTQQYTSTELTTQQITSTESTTQQITSTELTTQQYTSTESTTQQITSTESTTQQITITESTTQQITSTESTTPQITSTESTTQQITSTESTTQQTTSTDSTTQQISSTESTTQVTSTESTTQQQPSTDITTTQPTTTTTEQSTTPTTDTTKTTTDQTTSEATSTTTEQSTTSEKTTTESTTITEQATSTTTEQSTTETSKPSSAGQSTTTEEASSTTVQQSTELSTENQSSTSTTENGINASTTTESGQETTSTESSSPNKCPDTESDQYLYACPSSFKRHPKYCNLFYQCLEDNDTHELKIAVFNCPNGTIYDESKIQCVEERNAQKKCEGAIAQKRRFKRLNVNTKEIITASKNTYKCPGVGHFPFEKNEECSPALLRCDISKSGKLRGFVYRCPENQVYWSVSRKCEPISKMAHCKHSSSQWANRYEIPIERKNIAR